MNAKPIEVVRLQRGDHPEEVSEGRFDGLFSAQTWEKSLMLSYREWRRSEVNQITGSGFPSSSVAVVSIDFASLAALREDDSHPSTPPLTSCFNLLICSMTSLSSVVHYCIGLSSTLANGVAPTGAVGCMFRSIVISAASPDATLFPVITLGLPNHQLPWMIVL